ncbi:MAG: RICIN domain-containing protein, partial [Ruminococcus sp.]|nr:RICIN domain-containing protein [Ruminococcus sp.]
SNEKWSLNYVSKGVYEIVNSATGQILTANGTAIDLENDADGANQRWNITSVKKDFEGFDLYYKITSNANSSLALTYTEGAGFGLSAYTGANYQQYKLNLDGLQGYAANAKVSGGEKAGTIGGLLGDVVYVDTVEKMYNAMSSADPMTIVITANLDWKDWAKDKQTIKSNKTIVGSYAAHDLYDLQWRTDEFWGDSSIAPSNNIVFRNISVTSRTLNGKVMIQVYSSRNVWFDHITFNNTLSYDRTGDGMDEVGKFIWINTPVDNWSDGCYNQISPDYITLSYLKLQNRYWTVAYGTQNTETTRCRTSIMYCDWEKTVRRTPQIDNGTGHIYNNYFEGYGEGSNGSGTGQIIGGDGSDILSENNRFQGYTLREALMMGGGNDPAKDNGSYLSTTVSGTPSAVSFSPKKTSSLNPGGSIYGYSLVKAYSSDGNDTKKFCQTYAGSFGAKSGIKYITDSDMSGWIAKNYPTPFLRHVDLSAVTAAVFADGSAYRLKNVNSGLYMQVDGAKAENGTNVHQWGSADGYTHDIWKLISAGDGYYYLISQVGD